MWIDPLAVPQETLNVTTGELQHSGPHLAMTDTQYRRQLDAMIRGESRTNSLLATLSLAFTRENNSVSLLTSLVWMIPRSTCSARCFGGDRVHPQSAGTLALPECSAEDRVDDTDECLRETMALCTCRPATPCHER